MGSLEIFGSTAILQGDITSRSMKRPKLKLKKNADK
jgi:hypothetical protein